ncbi:hypothetical protein KL905_002081 [Ogataea polymorpha]|uniref:ENTH domain-containing protein n=1 Tax=Ogataea polymorpha TaxID=460523 RepID=A0A9P8PS75_9ASCO|nr:hypothetical protein KL937_001900 [Ogataea polymorpha]KAG7901414.1 hypothetical protein KL935_002480 [Ogataea polymorpha]KAG7905767.1 hypothetical protein KL907_002914 [Ogataea polymorpha]KAG7922059.1 hypothetical protein KL905_002081 [Ogataea polymorpha]KAG7936850.1 hypothetical protein KL904_002418 [Ogataea polymorpha]
MTTYEKIVKGATKIKLAPPKPKYIEPILMATAGGEKSEKFRVIMRSLAVRLDDTAWSIVYKALIVAHIMIREGEEDVTISYLAKNPHMLECRNIAKSGTFISNGGDLKTLKNYSKYLTTRAKEYANVKHDYIREMKKPVSSWSTKDTGSRLRSLSVDKGLLREVESVQKQVDALVRCRFAEAEVNNDVIILSFRMLVNDLLSLYQALNEGVVNILEHFFELSKYDAERAFEIYKHFTKETEQVVAFLRVAKHLEHVTKLHVPVIRHAQTGLTDSLDEYLHDPNFDINRRQYLAEKESKKSGKRDEPKEQQQQQQQQTVPPPQAATQSSPSDGLVFQQTGYNPFAGFTQMATGFSNQPVNGNFSGQPQFVSQQNFQTTLPLQQIPESQPVQQIHMSQTQPLQQTSTFQPFQPQQTATLQRSSTFDALPPPAEQNVYPQLTSSFTGTGFGGYSPQPPIQRQTTSSLRGNLKRQSTNPFALERSSSSNNPFAKLEAAGTGTNPFRSGSVSALPVQRQPTAGGLENLPTVPVFPETKQESSQQQAHQQAVFQLQQAAAQHKAQMTGMSQQQTGYNPFAQNQTGYNPFGSGVYNGPNLI